MSVLQVNSISGRELYDYKIEMPSNSRLNIGGTFSIGTETQFAIPVGTTAERPASPLAGMIRINSNYWKLEVYDGTNWVQYP